MYSQKNNVSMLNFRHGWIIIKKCGWNKYIIWKNYKRFVDLMKVITMILLLKMISLFILHMCYPDHMAVGQGIINIALVMI